MPHKYTLVAITGGIGAGKSVVSHILSVIGFPVYDCDSRARKLMAENKDIAARIAAEISAETIADDGTIDRRRLAAIVFEDAGLLQVLNGIVHHHVREDLRRWCDLTACDSKSILFVETAILRESGLDKMVDAVWHVTADTETRIQRVMKRNNISRKEVKQRIASQNDDTDYGKPTDIIINDGRLPLLPVILKLTEELLTVH